MWIRSEQSVCVWCATRTKNNSLNGKQSGVYRHHRCHLQMSWYLVLSFSSHLENYYLFWRCVSWWCCSKSLKNYCGKDTLFWPILHCVLPMVFSALLRIEPWWFQDQISEGKLVMVLKFNPKSTITIALKFISPRFHRSTRSSALEISWSRREPFDTAHETHCRHCVCSCCGCQHTFTLLHDTPHTPKAS